MTKKKKATSAKKTKSSADIAPAVSWTASSSIDAAAMPPYNLDGTLCFTFADQSKSPPKQPNKPLTLLGGSHHCKDILKQFQSQVPTTSVFRGLERPDCMPKSRKNVASSALSEEDRRIMKDFLIGPMRMFFSEFQDKGVGIRALASSTEATVDPESNKDVVRVDFYIVFGEQILVQDGGRPFINHLTHSDRERIITGALHRLVRVHGFVLRPKVVHTIGCMFIKTYTENHFYQELVDIRTILADIFLLRNYQSPGRLKGTDLVSIWQKHLERLLEASNADETKNAVEAVGVALKEAEIPCYDSDDCIRNSFLRIGEALEARGEFLTAAKLYLESTDSLWIGDGNPFLGYVRAGLAFMRNGDIGLSEENYIRGLSCFSTAKAYSFLFNVNIEFVSGALSNLVILYIFRQGKKPRAEVFVLIGLLFWAKYDGFDLTLGDNVAAVVVKPCAERIHEEFRNQQKANDAIREAFEGGTVESFHRQIFKYASSSLSLNLQVNIPEENNKKKRAAARKQLSQSENEYLFACGGPECNAMMIETKAKCCPCKNVFYCSKECQVKDWKTHKRVCAWKQQQTEG